MGDVRERLTLATLDEREYVSVLESASSTGISGGAIYDALLAHCALKMKVEAIYTWNPKHFNHLGVEVASRVKVPEA